MRGKLRQWFAENPCALNTAYVLTVAGTYLVEVGTNASAGASTGP